MPNDMVTGGNRAPQVEFLSSVLLVLWMCITVFAWFAPSSMDCRVFFRLSLLGAYRFTVFRAHLWQKLHTKVVFKHFDRDSYVLYIHISYIYISYIYIYIIYDHISNIIFPMKLPREIPCGTVHGLDQAIHRLGGAIHLPDFHGRRESHFPHGMGCYDGDMMEILL